jgi:NAD(P)-dependent dehydrogenase (short-subunit alcohol dehydrogenase family)
MSKIRGVIVTGASSGIGLECAKWLSGRGFHVFAGYRRKPDGERLKEIAPGRVTPVILDVTDQASITSAVNVVSKSSEEIAPFALLNNAGIVVAGPLEMLPLESFRSQIEVNLTGSLAVTQAFLPLLRAHHGRVVLMGSVLGSFALPFLGPYSCAKFALRALADSMNMELSGTGVSISLIEAGGIDTPIWEKSLRKAMDIAGHLPNTRWESYLDDGRSAMGYMMRLSKRGTSPVKVAQIVEKALTERIPRKKYRVGPYSRFVARVLPLFPTGFRQAILRRVILRR